MRIAACLARRRHSIAAALAASLAIACPYVTAAHENETYRIVDTRPEHVAALGRAERCARVDDGAFARQRDHAPMPVPVATPRPLVDGTAVTLWDEIGPPAPMPVPTDARHTVRGDGANYTRQ
ncbi:lipoprotein [Burkholderia pseudomallei]|nr:hypothetical protein EGY16_13365 [Burkholderia pseudomallei]KGS46502.1 hypothetical protein X992_3224 [Burkholderia pseudomallei MSHR5492]KGU95751.1 putative lipoprotein [Burkholderia pseudomallei MSHR4377]KGV25234.1 putative lipoprotein [Burkholderia pseudomallei MSHR4462]KGW75836.1 hypothetical protein Y046_564 [Burkholderia pseudomallei MSHR2990]KGW99624.1 putative lipoprotein [Burkholderia pseudomallei MSHR640]